MPELCIPNTEVHTRDFFLHKIDVEHLDVSVGPPKHLWLGQYNEYIEVVYKYFCETCTGSTQLIYGAFNLKSVIPNRKGDYGYPCFTPMLLITFSSNPLGAYKFSSQRLTMKCINPSLRGLWYPQ